MIDTAASLILIAVMAAVTALIRFAPFIMFRRSVPKAVVYLGNVLPSAIMAMLVVYCLKGVSFVSAPFGIPEIVSVLAVVLLHKWKHNTLISILGGTILYMILIRLPFTA